MNIHWKYFSLEQVNSQQGPDWKVWEQPEGYVSRGLKAFWAAEAARRQGEAVFDTFHFALLRARHERGLDIADTDVLVETAVSVGLEKSAFLRDLDDPELLNTLAKDHTFAVEKLGIFGTPTLVFPQNHAVFLKMSSPPSSDESVSVFDELRRLAENRPYILEVKRPELP